MHTSYGDRAAGIMLNSRTGTLQIRRIEVDALQPPLPSTGCDIVDDAVIESTLVTLKGLTRVRSISRLMVPVDALEADHTYTRIQNQ
jgi:hypothetical protein